MVGQHARSRFRRSDTLARPVDVQVELDRLRVELEELRTSLRQLVLAADADRRRIERDLHDGVHQQVVALAVDLQLLARAVGSNPAAAARLIAEMGDDVQRGLDQTVALAQRIYPVMLATGGLAALLRSAATDAGVRASVEVAAGLDCPAEVEMTVYLAWLAVLARGAGGARAAISVRAADDAVVFDLTGDTADLDPVRGRAEALGGRLAISPGRASGSLPLSS